MKKVVSVTMGSSKKDFSFETDFLGQRFKVQRLGADKDSKKAWELLRRQQAVADAIGLSEVADHCARRHHDHRQPRDAAPAEGRDARAGDHRRQAAPPAAGARGALRAEGTGPLLQQQPGALPERHAQLRDRGGAVGLHAEPELRRPGVPGRLAGAAGLAVAARAVRQGQRVGGHAKALAHAGEVAGRVEEHARGQRGGQVARHRRHLRRDQGRRLAGQPAAARR